MAPLCNRDVRLNRVVRSVRSTAGYRRLVRTDFGSRVRQAVTAVRASSQQRYSNFGEEEILAALLAEQRMVKVCVDMAASDGRTMSNTYALFREGWSGLSVEMDGRQFRSLASSYANLPNTVLFRGRVTPPNVVSILKAAEVPKRFGFLNLDIDGYDYYVLHELLAEFRPSIICAEINEKIPPPLRFTVKFDPRYTWDGSHFYGQSICQLDRLCERYDYRFVQLEYNNAFIMPTEITDRGLTAAEAYVSGYVQRTDRHERMPYNADMEVLQHLDPDAAVTFLHAAFAKHQGLYELDAGS